MVSGELRLRQMPGGSSAKFGWEPQRLMISQRALATDGTGGGRIHGEDSPLAATPLRPKKSPSGVTPEGQKSLDV
jgi:hypothetical protein